GALRARAARHAAEVAHAEPPPDLPPAPPGTDVVALPYTRTAELAEEVTGYTDGVVVLAPSSLRDAVVRRLRAAVEMGERLAPEVTRG
ncbi:WYL domain-containing protein, partial [Actinotalea sp. JY-7885]